MMKRLNQRLNQQSWLENLHMGAMLGLLLASLILLPSSIIACRTATSPTPPLAPGYLNSADQTLGQSLAAVNAFVTQEKANYAQLTPAQQATEKPYLNTLIDATAAADMAYTAYHQGSQTLAQAQTAYNQAQTAQNALSANKGVK